MTVLRRRTITKNNEEQMRYCMIAMAVSCLAHIISASTLSESEVGIETSLVSLIETKQVQKVDLNWTCVSVHMGTKRYVCEPVRFLFLFCTTQFLDVFWNGSLYFFRTRVNATPLWTSTQFSRVNGT